MKIQKNTCLDVAKHVCESYETVSKMFDLSRGAHVEPGSWMWKKLNASMALVDALYLSGWYDEAMLACDAWVDSWRQATETPKDFRFENGNLLALDGYQIEGQEISKSEELFS